MTEMNAPKSASDARKPSAQINQWQSVSEWAAESKEPRDHCGCRGSFVDHALRKGSNFSPLAELWRSCSEALEFI